MEKPGAKARLMRKMHVPSRLTLNDSRCKGAQAAVGPGTPAVCIKETCMPSVPQVGSVSSAIAHLRWKERYLYCLRAIRDSCCLICLACVLLSTPITFATQVYQY